MTEFPRQSDSTDEDMSIFLLGFMLFQVAHYIVSIYSYYYSASLDDNPTSMNAFLCLLVSLSFFAQSPIGTRFVIESSLNTIFLSRQVSPSVIVI